MIAQQSPLSALFGSVSTVQNTVLVAAAAVAGGMGCIQTVP
ncbi:hypothetical protein [Algimonas arctica]|nr:hypothetical protein [Algimonas arctica]